MIQIICIIFFVDVLLKGGGYVFLNRLIQCFSSFPNEKADTGLYLVFSEDCWIFKMTIKPKISSSHCLNSGPKGWG